MDSSRTTELSDLVREIKSRFDEHKSILSFREYFSLVTREPKLHLRSSSQYLVDAIDSFGTTDIERPTGKVTRYNLFDAPFDGGERRVAGQEVVQDALYRIFSNFAREGRVNKVVLLHGPNGSAKSSIVRCLMGGLEHYSHQPEGALYTFNWVFPSDRHGKGGIGFGSERNHEDTESHAHLPAEAIDARIPTEMHEHPLFLLPREQRMALLDELLPADAPGGRRTSDYLRYGELSYKSKKIFDALMAAYDGQVEKVYNHVQVQRFYLNRRYREGVATIEPQVSVDASIRQVTADRTLAELPKTLQHISLFEPSGALVDANRGLLEFSDLLKRPVEAFKYLLSTAETATVSMDSFVLHLDMVYVASTNETYLDAFKEHPDFPSFKGRMELVKVPYLLVYGQEKDIYGPQITEQIVGRHVAPHAIEVAATWAVLTRMRRCDSSKYPKDMQSVIESIVPLEKMRLYDTGDVPDRLTTRESQELKQLVSQMYRESMGYPNYEGRWGASAREIRTALLNAAHHEDYDYLSPVAVFEEIRDILKSKGVYDFLKQEIVGKYHDHADFLVQTELMYIHWIDEEIRDALGLAPEESYLDLFSRYVNHVSHWVKKEKMLDARSGKFHDPDKPFMEQIEKVLMGQGEKADDFRNSIIGTIGARALESPDDQTPDYGTLFKSYIERLREDFFTSRRKIVQKSLRNFQSYCDDPESLDDKEAVEAKEMMGRLQDRYHYNKRSARDTVAYLIKHRYNE